MIYAFGRLLPQTPIILNFNGRFLSKIQRQCIDYGTNVMNRKHCLQPSYTFQNKIPIKTKKVKEPRINVGT